MTKMGQFHLYLTIGLVVLVGFLCQNIYRMDRKIDLIHKVAKEIDESEANSQKLKLSEVKCP